MVCLPAYTLMALVSVVETFVKGIFFIIARSLEFLTCSRKNRVSNFFASATIFNAMICGTNFACIFFNFFKKPMMSHTKFNEKFVEPCSEFGDSFSCTQKSSGAIYNHS